MGGCFQSSYAKHESTVTLGDFSIIKQSKLAEGAYGDVWKCKSSHDDCIYALKEIKLQNKELKDMYEKEARILIKLREKGVTRSVRLLKSGIQVREEVGGVGCLLFQLGTISLFDEISSHKLTNSEFLNILDEISSALEQIHNIGVCHLDLKPQNLVLVDGLYKLCDYGSAMQKQIDCKSLSKKQKNQMQEYIDSNSTLIYRSPQMIVLEDQVIGYASDIWMLGCIAYFLYFRKHPFEGQGKLAIISPNVRYPQESEITKLIQSLLTLQPQSRPTANAVRQRIKQLQKLI